MQEGIFQYLSTNVHLAKAVELSRAGQTQEARRELSLAMPITSEGLVEVELVKARILGIENRWAEACAQYRKTLTLALRRKVGERKFLHVLAPYVQALFFLWEPARAAAFALRLGLKQCKIAFSWERIIQLCHAYGEWRREAFFWAELGKLPRLSVREKAQAFYHQGVAWIKADEIELAEQCLYEAIAVLRGESEPYAWMGSIHMRKGRWLKAFESLSVSYRLGMRDDQLARELAIASVLAEADCTYARQILPLALEKAQAFEALVGYVLNEVPVRQGMDLCERLQNLLREFPQKTQEKERFEKFLVSSRSRLEVWEECLPGISEKYWKCDIRDFGWRRYVEFVSQKTDETVELFASICGTGLNLGELSAFVEEQTREGIFVPLQLATFLEILEIIRKVCREKEKPFTCKIRLNPKQEDMFSIRRRQLTFGGGSRFLLIAPQKKEVFEEGIRKYLKRHRII